jgi:hypothetical protein
MRLDECQIAISGQSLPIFISGGLEFSYLGKDLDEADGEPEETLASITVRERTAEHFHDVLNGD